MVQSASQNLFASRLHRTSKISGYGKMIIFGNFSHFGPKFKPFAFEIGLKLHEIKNLELKS